MHTKKIIYGVIILLIFIGAIYFVNNYFLNPGPLAENSGENKTDFTSRSTHIFSGRVIKKVGEASVGNQKEFQYEIELINTGNNNSKGVVNSPTIISSATPLTVGYNSTHGFYTIYNARYAWYSVLTRSTVIID